MRQCSLCLSFLEEELAGLSGGKGKTATIISEGIHNALIFNMLVSSLSVIRERNLMGFSECLQW